MTRVAPIAAVLALAGCSLANTITGTAPPAVGPVPSVVIPHAPANAAPIAALEIRDAAGNILLSSPGPVVLGSP